MAENLTT